MDRRYVKLYRKLFDKGYLKKPKLWALMTYCLLRAAYKDKTVIMNGREIYLNPGELIFGRRSVARVLGQTEREIRTRLNFLKSTQFASHRTTHRISIVSIVNWDSYQSNENENVPLNDQIPSHHRPQRKKDKNIYGEILALKERYDADLIDKAFQAIRSTRKTGKVKDSVILGELQYWNHYPVGVVEAAIETYLKKNY